jgi:hypothetical protein
MDDISNKFPISPHESTGADCCGFIVARRREINNEQLSEADLAALRKRLEAMTLSELEMFYRASHNSCRYEFRVPAPIVVQEFVTAWKQLRRAKKPFA